MTKIDFYDQYKKFFQVDLESLAPIEFALFMQQIEQGTGDYTREKYERPEMTMDEIKAELNAMREREKNDG